MLTGVRLVLLLGAHVVLKLNRRATDVGLSAERALLVKIPGMYWSCEEVALAADVLEEGRHEAASPTGEAADTSEGGYHDGASPTGEAADTSEDGHHDGESPTSETADESRRHCVDSESTRAMCLRIVSIGK